VKLLLLFFLFSFSRFLAACPTTNLIHQENSPFNKIPVYDQDGSGLCHAYAAAQLVDYHLISKGQARRSIHPAWVGLTHAQYRGRDHIAGGAIDKAIQSLTLIGNCSYEDVADSLKSLVNRAGITEAELLSVIGKLARAMGQNGPAYSSHQLQSAFETARQLHEPFCSPGALLDNLLPELETLNVLSSEKMLSSLLVPGCLNKTPLTLPSPRYNKFNSDEEVLPHLEKSLLSGKPVSISFCSKVIQVPSFDGLPNNKDRFKSTSDCGDHEALIVGSKKVGNSCKLLLRNSWGSSWSKSNDSYKCLCRNRVNGALKDDCTSTTHNDGLWVVEACWMDAENLSRNTWAATTLQE
jgi:hypothetical protein